jgi:formate hydrogenlyase subunit 6/NADH:ubiquinone oxidoreductase subunit I
MPDTPFPERPPVRIDRSGLQALLDSLLAQGWEVVGPVVRDSAIVFDNIQQVSDLPRGWTAEAGPGRFRLRARPDDALFGWAVGPHSAKRFLHPSEVRLFAAQRTNGAFHILGDGPPTPKRALIGLKACDLEAIARQDRALLGDKYADPLYQARRDRVFLIAVDCTEAAPTCFCASMGTGPECKGAYDIALTEIGDAFLARAGSGRGAALLEEIPHEAAPKTLQKEAREAVKAAAQQQRRIDQEGLHDALLANPDHPRWEKVGQKCMACGSCTQVCPTCFCMTVEDASSLDAHTAERWRRWDSCFTLQFSYIHGGVVRGSIKSRYRQWLTHKLATWVDQFGTPGCVGCGRCIAWCPAGIDITEEAAAFLPTRS